MANLTLKQRRRGLEFANRVAKLALEAPDELAKKDVYQAVQSMRQRYGLSDQEKKNEILKLLRIGCSTRSDLVNEMVGFRQQDVYALINALQSEGAIEIRKMSIAGTGRPAEFITITSQNSTFSPQK